MSLQKPLLPQEIFIGWWFLLSAPERYTIIGAFMVDVVLIWTALVSRDLPLCHPPLDALCPWIILPLLNGSIVVVLRRFFFGIVVLCDNFLFLVRNRLCGDMDWLQWWLNTFHVTCLYPRCLYGLIWPVMQAAEAFFFNNTSKVNKQLRWLYQPPLIR